LQAGPPFGPPTTGPYNVTVLAGGQAELRDSMGTLLSSGPANGWLGGDGFSIRLSGQPAEGDSFRVERASADEGNNGNAAALLSLRDRSGPGGSFADAQDAMVSAITVALAETRARADVASRNRDGAAESLQQSSGVDLNTEAAEMLRLQQAFQANSRIIQTAREIFDAILAAAR
jgi:flagellar hook-associated protein 1 FlgK